MQPMRLDEVMSTALVVEQVHKARRAQSEWSRWPVCRRLAVLRRARRALAARSLGAESGLAFLPPDAEGAARAETLTAEVIPLAEALRFLEREAEAILAPRRPGSSGRPVWLAGVDLEVRREPLGVVLVIGPSSYPLFLPGVQTVQALAAGNAVVLKPGRGGTAAARGLADLLRQAGLPTGLLGILPEDPVAVRQALDASDGHGIGSGRGIGGGIDKVLLTGSAASGREVLAELAPRLTPAVMELSGCDAAFVREDADVERVVAALTFGLRLRGGVTCIAPRRVFVDARRAPELTARLDREAWRLSPVAVAPEIARRARDLIRQALRSGARCLTGPPSPSRIQAGAFPAVVLADVPPQAEILRVDLPAPVLSLVPVADDDEALALAEECPYALGATVFGAEAGARALAERVRAGVVVVNDAIVPTADPRLPFGGRGESGFGVTRGAEGLLALTVPKAVAVRRRSRGRLRHLEPVTAGDEALFRAFLALSHGGLGTRLRGLAALARALGRRIVRPPAKAAEPLVSPSGDTSSNSTLQNPIGRTPEEVLR